MRQLEGRSIDVPVVTAITSSVEGADLKKLADQTSSSQQVRPKTMAIAVKLSGAGTVELVAHVRVSVAEPGGDLGWFKCADTGNLGVLAGRSLPSPGSYVVLVSFAAIYTAFVLLAQNNVGGVTFDMVKLIEYAEYVRER